jgi:hypothetical protein
MIKDSSSFHIRYLHKKSENLSLTFYIKKSPLPNVGGDEGEGGLNLDQIFFVHPHPRPPPSKGEGIIGEISNIFV